MPYKRITYQEKAYVGIIDIVEPPDTRDKKIELYHELLNLREAINSDEKVRVIILKASNPKSFSMGEEMAEKAPVVNNSESEKPISIFDPVNGIDLPIIAAVTGDATGPGLELILACDIRIATNKSRFSFPEIKKRLIPMNGGTQRLARLVGKGKALEVILTGEWINAQEALRIGLVNQVVPKGDVYKVAMELAKDMVTKSPVSTRYAREAICKGMELNLDQGLRLEADLYFLLHTTRDRTEGIRAFQEKRKAHFEGR